MEIGEENGGGVVGSGVAGIHIKLANRIGLEKRDFWVKVDRGSGGEGGNGERGGIERGSYAQQEGGMKDDAVSMGWGQIQIGMKVRGDIESRS